MQNTTLRKITIIGSYHLLLVIQLKTGYTFLWLNSPFKSFPYQIDWTLLLINILFVKFLWMQLYLKPYSITLVFGVYLCLICLLLGMELYP